MKWHKRLRHLDNVVFGPPVPDNRPLAQRLLRPRPAVWSPAGLLRYAVVVVAMLAVIRWAGDTAAGVVAFLALLVVAFLIMAAGERKRARQHQNPDEG